MGESGRGFGFSGSVGGGTLAVCDDLFAVNAQAPALARALCGGVWGFRFSIGWGPVSCMNALWPTGDCIDM